MGETKLDEFLKENKGSHELPEGWRWVRLGDIAEINPDKKEIKNLNENIDVSFIPMDAINEEKGEITTSEVRKLKQVKKGYTYFKEGDVIFAKITPCMENGKCAVAKNLINHLGFGSTEFHIIRANKNIIPEWVWYYLRQKQIREEATKYFTGSVGQQRVPKEFLNRLEIPSPPFSEQKRIVARIEELFSKIDEIKKLRKESLEQVKALLTSALHEVFSKTDEKGWECVKLGEIVEIWDKDRIPVKKDDRKPGPYPYCGANGIIDHVEGYTHDGEFTLLAEDGGFYGAGEISAYIMRGKFWANNHVHILKAIGGVAENLFLVYYLNFTDLTSYLTGATRPKLPQKTMCEIPIPLPSLEEQKRIVVYLDKMQEKAIALQKLQEETEKEIEILRETLLHKAFRGEL